MEPLLFMELSSIAGVIHFKTSEVFQKTDLDMRELLGVDKAFQAIQSELVNDAWKLTESDKRIKIDNTKLNRSWR